MHRRHFLAGVTAFAVTDWLGSARAAEADLFPIVETEHGRFAASSPAASRCSRACAMAQTPADAIASCRRSPCRNGRAFAMRSTTATSRRRFPRIVVARYADLILNDLQPGGMGEDCLVAQSVDAGAEGEQQASGHRAIPRRRFLRRLEQLTGWRRRNAGALRRLRRHHSESSSERVRLSVSRRGRRRSRTAGSVGMQDLVAALQWVSRNVAAFGGDPGRVLIFGQSGGGAKVSHLLAMPARARTVS